MLSFSRQSIVVKFILLVVFTNTTILSAIGLWEYRTIRSNLLLELQQRSEAISERMALALVKIVWDYDELLAGDILSSALNEKGVVGVQVYEVDDWQPLYQRWKDEKGVIQETPPFQDLQALVSSSHAMTMKTNEIGKVSIYLSDVAARATLNRAVWTISLSVLGQSILISLLLALLIRRFIFKPLLALQEGMTKIEEGRLDFEVKVDVQDEIGKMADGFNHMAEKLHSRTR